MTPANERVLADACLRFVDDPLGYVRFMFPWGEGALKGWDGPDWWHLEVFEAIVGYLKGDRKQPFQSAVATGHGTAKTTCISWLIHWFMDTRPNAMARVTANTETQLLKTTWRELNKWHQMKLSREWWEWTATSYYRKSHPATWAANAITWSETSTQSFAGAHDKHLAFFFDEGSDISDKIYEVADGAMTTPGAMWFVFGNPTRNIGRFYQCFKDPLHSKYWRTWQIDARKCKASTKNGPEYLERLIEQYGGLNDDRARVRVLGQFPERAGGQFISTVAVDKAMRTEVEYWQHMPKLMSVDVARFGDNDTMICWRQGRKVFPLEKMPKVDLVELSKMIGARIKAERPMVVFIDGAGMGAGVVDNLRHLGFSVIDVNGGNSSSDPLYLNKRAEMWQGMKDWMESPTDVELPNDPELRKHLTAVKYGYTDKGRLRLERKEDIVAEFGFSPDRADALAMTFAYPVADVKYSREDLEPEAFEDS